MAKSFLGQQDLPKGIRNNNIGNLIRTDIQWEGKIPHWQSTDPHFEQFVNIEYGIRALMRDVITDHGKGLNTLTSLINEYAPPHENNTNSYVAFVANAANIGANSVFTLTKESLIAICKAIAVMENGQIARTIITDSDYEAAYKILGKQLPSSSGGFGSIIPLSLIFLLSFFALK